MARSRRTQRSAVSYIDKSRAFYAAQGYERPYAWASHVDAPFTAPTKSLADSRVGIVTTTYFLPEGFVYRVPQDLPRLPFAARDDEIERLDTEHLSWAKDETHTEDPGSFLPVVALQKLAAEGRIGSVSPRFYGLPTQFSHRVTQRRDTPALLEWMREDDVDLAMMVPL